MDLEVDRRRISICDLPPIWLSTTVNWTHCCQPPTSWAAWQLFTVGGLLYAVYAYACAYLDITILYQKSDSVNQFAFT